MPSFDIVSQVDQQEVKNAVEQANKEIQNRYDFKGSDARIEQKELALTVYADDEFKLGQVTDVLRQDMAKGIQKLVKDSKLKVQSSIQGDLVRVSGAKRDDLQAAIQLVRASVTDIPLQFINFRD